MSPTRELASSQLEREKNEVAERLRNVRAGMTDSDFQGLVERIALINLKYRGRTADYALPLGQRTDP